MSLVQLFRKKSQASKLDLFTTPSHCQKFFIFNKFRQFYKYDLSETDAHNPQPALKAAQKRASEIYKTNSTHFLTNGSTSGIVCAVLTCVKKGDGVLIWGNAHICHKNAVRLAGAEPVFFEVEKDEEWGVYKPADFQTIENKLKSGKIKAVIVTSPTYEGLVCDISSISSVCKKHGAYLIVDEAHGALYPFCESLPVSAIYQGADFVVQSLHKTAGGLNPTAVLHCNTKGLDVEGSLALVSTTSPSYPLLGSIEKNINFLNSKKGRKTILELIANIENMKKNLQNSNSCEFYNGDPTKILVKIRNLSGFELSETLFEKYRIEDEIECEKAVMLLCGVGTDSKKIKRLERALTRLSQHNAGG